MFLEIIYQLDLSTQYASQDTGMKYVLSPVYICVPSSARLWKITKVVEETTLGWLDDGYWQMIPQGVYCYELRLKSSVVKDLMVF